MDINRAFPSKYVSADDLGGREVPVTIDRCVMENAAAEGQPEEWVPVVYFQGFHKGLRLNRTNATSIANLYGLETDNWTGKPITLYPTEVLFQGRNTPCIRIRPPAQQPLQQPLTTLLQPAPQSAPQPMQSTDGATQNPQW